MPTYSNHPPEDPRGNALDLKRTPTAKPLIAAVTSDDIIGTPTHFYGGRTIPCEGPECEAHRHGVPWRWHGYLGAFDPAINRHFLFEFTARMSEAFVDYRDVHGTLRGCLFRAKRVNNRPNAKVYITTKRANLETISLPPEPNVMEALAIIWNIATPHLDVEGLMKKVPRLHVDKNGNGHALTPRDLLNQIDNA